MRSVIDGFLKAAGWGTAAIAAGAAGAGLYAAGVYTGAKVQRKITRAVVGSSMNVIGAGNKPEDPAVPEPMKTAGWGTVIGAGALLGAGAVAGAKIQKGLSRGPVMKADSFRAQMRQKQLERQGSFATN